ncbi:helix-turn-helix transcriptional regulator [Mesorhizobium sp. B2-7-1]|uniref:helix-turn-helix domain-containing protein n=1 Tax=Mesorhizobium sp. B2-7-1 TaxID=2589909 RepID=UPI00112C066E|nr:helix-turn-helix transcriptional regulator [Mesorhizobium sp. B2-7-1]TPJ41048.1 XRE family transcriptional regulator [Mesorhizobium sp. B2-7-1]
MSTKKEDNMELVHGSGNVFRDFNRDDADLLQAKALMASEIIKILDERNWTTRKAEDATGINHADFSRIRRANLGRFTLDRLMIVLTSLGQEVELSVSVRPRASVVRAEPAGI